MIGRRGGFPNCDKRGAFVFNLEDQIRNLKRGQDACGIHRLIKIEKTFLYTNGHIAPLFERAYPAAFFEQRIGFFSVIRNGLGGLGGTVGGT